MPTTLSPAPGPYHLIGNNLAADFANTRYSAEHIEGSLRNSNDVVAFLVATGALKPADAAELRRSLRDPVKAERFFKRALQLRGAVVEMLEAIVRPRALSDSALWILNEALRAESGYDAIEPRSKMRHGLVRHRAGSGPEYVLAQIARAAAELLVTPNAPVRKCGNPECIRYFYDQSRTRRRRWCEMAVCGNRAKTVAFVERRRAQKPD